MALMEVNFFSKALMRPVTMNVILPVDKVFFGEETEEENKPFKTLYLLHGVMGNYTDWVTGTCIKRWAEEKNLAVVMPSGANMFYMDHPNANENYSEFIGKELVKNYTKNSFHPAIKHAKCKSDQDTDHHCCCTRYMIRCHAVT